MFEPFEDVRIRYLGLLASLGLRAIKSSCRLERRGPVFEQDPHWAAGPPCILAFWHGQQLLAPWSYRGASNGGKKRKIFTLISRHGDGQIAAAALRHLSISSVSGSSHRGGAKAFLELKSRLEQGYHAAITPDGPTGPARVAKDGVIKLASAAGVPILPLAIAADRIWQLHSWDAMFLPKPFSRVTLLTGELLRFPPGMSRNELENGARQLTDVLNALTREAEMSLQGKVAG